MTEAASTNKKHAFSLSVKQTLVALYVVESILIGAACYFENDYIFKPLGPIVMGIAAAYLLNAFKADTRPVLRYLKALGLSLLVFFAAIATGGVVAAAIRGFFGKPHI